MEILIFLWSTAIKIYKTKIKLLTSANSPKVRFCHIFFLEDNMAHGYLVIKYQLSKKWKLNFLFDFADYF